MHETRMQLWDTDYLLMLSKKYIKITKISILEQKYIGYIKALSMTHYFYFQKLSRPWFFFHLNSQSEATEQPPSQEISVLLRENFAVQGDAAMGKQSQYSGLHCARLLKKNTQCSSTRHKCLEFVSAKCFLLMLKYLLVKSISTKGTSSEHETLFSSHVLNCCKNSPPRVICAGLHVWNVSKVFFCCLMLFCVIQWPVQCVCVRALYYLSPCCRARCSIISRQYWVALGPLYSHNLGPGASHSRAGQSDRW